MKHTQYFAHELVNWYKLNARVLPFRENHDPYAIFISEMMLQQTQVSTMLPYFKRFMTKFSTIESLSKASLDEVLSLWEGLGYYRRAKYIHETAKIIMDKHNGVFPKDLKSIKGLKGVGDYTAGAIHSIAYNEPSPAVDGNVLRVVTRFLGIYDDITEKSTVNSVTNYVEATLLHEPPRYLTQAIMELGALVCTKTPKCETCPLNAKCFAYKHNAQLEIPVKQKLKAKTHDHHIVFIIENMDNQFLMSRQPTSGLLANMLLFPYFEATVYQDALDQLLQMHDLTILSSTYLDTIKHVFTHKVWHMKVYHIKTQSKLPEFYDLKALPSALPTAHKKLVKLVLKK